MMKRYLMGLAFTAVLSSGLSGMDKKDNKGLSIKQRGQLALHLIAKKIKKDERPVYVVRKPSEESQKHFKKATDLLLEAQNKHKRSISLRNFAERQLENEGKVQISDPSNSIQYKNCSDSFDIKAQSDEARKISQERVEEWLRKDDLTVKDFLNKNNLFGLDENKQQKLVLEKSDTSKKKRIKNPFSSQSK